MGFRVDGGLMEFRLQGISLAARSVAGPSCWRVFGGVSRKAQSGFRVWAMPEDRALNSFKPGA